MYPIESHTDVDENRSKFLPLEHKRNQKGLFLNHCFEEVRYFIFRVLAKENGASVGQINSVRAIIYSDGIYKGTGSCSYL